MAFRSIDELALYLDENLERDAYGGVIAYKLCSYLKDQIERELDIQKTYDSYVFVKLSRLYVPMIYYLKGHGIFSIFTGRIIELRYV